MIAPDVLRRVTVSPAQSLSTCTSKCDLFGSCAGYCCAFLGTPFKYLATRFDWHHVTSSWFRNYSCQTLDRFRDVYTILREIRTAHGSTRKQRCLLSFENWTVLDCICLSSTQFHSRSFDCTALSESQVFQQMRNMFLVRLINSSFDHSDRSVQHFQFFVQIFCCTNHADPSRVKMFLATFSQKSRFDLLLPQSQKSSPWQNPFTSSDLYNAVLLAPSSKPLLRRCSPHSLCHALLASCVP